MGKRHGARIVHERFKVAKEYETGKRRAMAAIRLMVVSAPGRIVGPGAAKAGSNQWVCRRNTRVERANDRSILRWCRNTLRQFRDPVVLTSPISPRSKNGSMVPVARRISVIAPGTRPAKSATVATVAWIYRTVVSGKTRRSS